MNKDRVLIVQNDVVENLGLYETFLCERANVDVIQAYSMKTSDSFPRTESYSAFIIGPTPISANEVQNHAFLVSEWEYLSRVISSGKPVLGVCCGGQMLARHLGAEVVKSPSKEVGGYTVMLSELGSKDPIFRGFPRAVPVFQWHSDMFKVPPGGHLLARGEPCPIQAYSRGNVRGIIFHLEIDHRNAERWASTYPEELNFVGKTKEQVIEECKIREPEMRRLAELLVENFLTLV